LLATRAHGRVVHPALEGLQHFDDERDDALGRVVLATLLDFCQGELTEDVFALEIQRLAVVVLAVEVGVGEMSDQVGQFVVVDLGAGKVLVEQRLASVHGRLRVKARKPARFGHCRSNRHHPSSLGNPHHAWRSAIRPII
jgi:hypothetical protein